MTTNFYSPPWPFSARIRRLDKGSLLAWSSTVLATLAGFSGAIDQSWAVPLVAFCAGMGVAFACRSAAASCRRNAMAGRQPSARAPSASQGIWQEIDHHRDLLHLLHEKTHSAARDTGSTVARSGPIGRKRGHGQK
ncbi:hypothetical protein M2650_15095 [Luteimonas sp. SX5]|uniref:Uncharacterized protein n=1 Tax=Luteimonas galliterrae TaxID=2940486 RepID=A0ABT0MMQ2_9GAMM|nr:hypothetical protein [Luteimonas galliterrae]MCL1635948.1 hypothetical protein [Luteimonas galliterrae]